MADPQASKYTVSALSDKGLKYLTSIIIAVDWPQQAFVSSAKIHVSNVKCEHNHSSEQLARHWKATLELRKIKRYRTLNVVVGSF